MSIDDGGVGLLLWGDQLTSKEKERMEVVLADLKNVSRASRLIDLIDKQGGIQPETQPFLFEARIARELQRQGIQFDYEHEARDGETKSIDFRIEGDPEFLIEVVSLRTSEGVKEASYDQDGWFRFGMSSYNLDDKVLEKQSEESEITVAQGKLVEKVQKFPEPQPGRLHIIVADVRGLGAPAPAGAIGISDLREYLRLVTYGWGCEYRFEGHPPERLSMSIPQKDGTHRRIQGVFEDGADRPLFAPLLRERIHAIHFVREKSFTPGEIISSASCMVPNRHLVKSEESWDALASAYPLLYSPKRE